MDFQTIKVHIKEKICFIQFYRPEANNTMNDRMIEEFHHVLNLCEEAAVTVVVLEGLPEVFCLGADFESIHRKIEERSVTGGDPEPIYDLWLRLSNGPYITISHVRGRVNAGGIGFVAASDIVLADPTAQFSLSELLFGLFPACVLPFLIRRIGVQKAHYMTLMTWPVGVQQAHAWGLVDTYHSESEVLLGKHLRRLKLLSRFGISSYKRYMNMLHQSLYQSKLIALSANREMFSDSANLERIYKFVETGHFPWEDDSSRRN
ncbi:enoyl-CoA hydratase/isomerase [Brevibacillus laterosporus]|uniref:enoyl-CoA hydratase/isomerase n=1 Tax=Brevibacillus laterosporus TaxID=1465 RepID=UPI0015E203C1|nr:enoyl-CoA hydratase/isomerase [Brevibacillus laterosporus]